MTTAGVLRSRNRVDRASLPWRLVFGVVLVLFGVFCLIPFIMVISVSLTPQSVIDEMGYQFIPQQFSLDAYRYLFRFPEMLIKAYGVSIFITVVGTLLNLLLTALLAYPLSRMEFRHRGKVAVFLFFTMIFSGGMVPYYILVRQ